MPLECPNCRRGVPRLRVLARTAWGRWTCAECGALLGVDTRRRLLAIMPSAGVFLVLLFAARKFGTGLIFALPVLFVIMLGMICLLDRVVLVRRAGMRCRECGYDLQGQTDDICPECGAGFDPGEVAVVDRSSMPSAASLRWRRILIAAVFTLLTGAFVLGLLVLRSRQAGGPPPPPPTTPATP